ncbi:angiotensin-converting enzyme-like [Achroia grisella]|uniref:angiotensin-converting enzyme-like n=1 Tax=Achroia grisella TaxID=688607 RepID=UPI0027D1F333|nr:angiotensin-converting enzyme-like [Achroia grisella]
MRLSASLLCIYFYALLSSGTSSSGDDRRWLVVLVDLVELDYVDHCEQRATATWNELIGGNKGLSTKLERDKAFGIFSKHQTTEVRKGLSGYTLAANDDVLKRKVKLLLQPGDTLLEPEQWIKLVTFGNTALHRIRFATDYDCGNNRSCTLRELQSSLARQQDEETLISMKKSWEQNLPDMTEYLEQILPLLRNASKENEHESVEDYWNFLVEYEGALLKARELWDNIKPLYIKLHKYVSLRLKGSDAVGNPLPVHLLKSLNGDDWSNIIESLLPQHPAIYQKVQANLQLKDLGGINAFKAAFNLIEELKLGELEADLWTDSIFNSTCPPVLLDWCKPNKVRIVSCKDVSLVNYVDAHEAAMKMKYKEIAAVHSNNTYILREAPRYSATFEAIPGFISLLALNPHALNRSGLFPLDVFSYNANHHRLVLQLITALQDLPKLNFYLAADEWRLKVLMGLIPYSKIPSSWSEFRKEFSLLETSDIDLLGDPYILFNKPFIGKFMGLILKYQIYHSFADELISDEHDLVNHVSENNERISNTMMQGFGRPWPEMISELLATRENGLEFTGLTDYYRLLDDYLDRQLDPPKESSDDYIEPVTEPSPEENEIIEISREKTEATIKDETHEDLLENVIDTGIDDLLAKFGAETSTVGVLEIKNPVHSGDQSKDVKEASYNTYWWIGIAVVLAIIVILIAIIARKRHNHRKQLERQRRDNTHA